MTVAPAESAQLDMRRGFRLCLNKFCPRSWSLSQKQPLLEMGRDKTRGHHCDLGRFCSQAGHVCAWTTVTLRQHKSWLIWCRKALPPASLSGASAPKKNVIWELDFFYYCFQSGSACCGNVAQTFSVL